MKWLRKHIARGSYIAKLLYATMDTGSKKFLIFDEDPVKF